MTEILIKNGYVIDPLNNIKGDIMDIGVKNGKIVDPSEIDSSKAITIDASKRLVVAGGIDIHSHVAGPKVNIGRLMRAEDHYLTNIPHNLPYRHSMTGRTVPNTWAIGYLYALMGYTFVVEPASPAIKMRHTHHELNSIPIIDKAVYVLVDSHWAALDLIRDRNEDLLSAYFAWLLKSFKAYALKLVDPGCDFVWLMNRAPPPIDLDDQLPYYGITPRDIITSIGRASIRLNLPKHIHVHANKLGFPGNITTLINTMRLSKDIMAVGRGRGYAIHLTHIQFNAYGGDSWSTLESGGEQVAKELRANPYTTIDMGQIIFGRATTMTADADFEYVLYHLTRFKWASVDTETDAAAGIVPYVYRKKSYVNTIQWTIGLETALLSNDPWRVIISTDHPNAGPFIEYPRIFAWLMSRKFREETMKNVNQRALKKTALPAIDSEWSLYDIIISTRAAPAKLLGLEKEKGHLGIGADADIAIYDIDPRSIDPSREYEKIIKVFSRAWLVVKGGEIVVKEGEIIRTIYGKTYYVDVELPEDLEKEAKRYASESLSKYYTVSLDNLVIRDNEIRGRAIRVKPMLR